MGERSFNKYFTIFLVFARLARKFYVQYRTATDPEGPEGSKITAEEGFELAMAMQDELTMALPELEWAIIAVPAEPMVD